MDLGWPFARTRRESKAAIPLVALSQLGSPAWGGRDAASLTQDGYLRNAVAYRCVRMVAEAAASVPRVTAHAGAAKLLRAPAPDVAGAGFLEGIYTQLQLAGNAFVEAVQIDGRDGIAALSVKRDAPWECLETASFATVEEKHAIAGLGT